MQALRDELAAYYATLPADDPTAPYRAEIAGIWQEMHAWATAHPDAPGVLLKARLHEVIARRCTPVIFPHSPFYWEIGLRAAPNWGVGRGPSAGYWLRDRRQAAMVDPQAAAGLREIAELKVSPVTYFDEDHRCLGYTTLLNEGITGLLRRIAERQALPGNAAQQAFLEASARSCRAVLTIAAKFAAHARELLAQECDPPCAAIWR